MRIMHTICSRCQKVRKMVTNAALCLVVLTSAAHVRFCVGVETSVPGPLEAVLDNFTFYDRHALPDIDTGSPTLVNITMYIEGLTSFQAQTMCGQVTAQFSGASDTAEITSTGSCTSEHDSFFDFSVDIYFQEYWVDDRLKHNQSHRILIRDRAMFDKMWHPDIYFANARSAKYHHVTAENFLAWVYADGSVYYDTRISLTVMCMMDLSKYPLDTQSCNLRILSYAYTDEELLLMWKSPDRSITKNKNIKLPDMHLLGIKQGYCDGEYDAGNWSCAEAVFEVRREIMHHILQSYIPTALIVVISWFSFWLDVDAVPGRVSLCITTLLTLATQASAARLALPQVSYIKAIDVWMGTCLAFVFGVMIEFTLVNYLSRKKPNSVNHSSTISRKRATSYGELPNNSWKGSPLAHFGNSTLTRRTFTSETTLGVPSPAQRRRGNEEHHNGYISMQPPPPPPIPKAPSITFHEYIPSSSATRYANDSPSPDGPRYSFRHKSRKIGIAIDRYCRTVFPLMFLIFNIAYWPYYIFIPNPKVYS